MDVSEQILKSRQIYGGSDNTDPSGLAASGNFNYAGELSINEPLEINITTIPYTFKFKNTVGLFGTENRFIKINMNLLSTGSGCIPLNTYDCMILTDKDFLTVNTYQQGLIGERNPDLDYPDYEPAATTQEFINHTGTRLYAGVLLQNLGSGNSWIDRWFDVRLYTDKKEEHPFDLMYAPIKYSFYIGFHARDTKRLPYEVNCTVGLDYKPFAELGAEKRFVPRDLH